MPILRRRSRAILYLIIGLTFICVQAQVVSAANLESLSGGQVSLDKYKGKQPVLLFFWTTWCPYCRDEIKNLNQTNAELKKEGIMVFAVDVGESKYKVNRFFKGYLLKISVLLDEDSSFSQGQDLFGVPTYIMFDKNGTEVYRDNIFPKNFKSLIVKKG